MLHHLSVVTYPTRHDWVIGFIVYLDFPVKVENDVNMSDEYVLEAD